MIATTERPPLLLRLAAPVAWRDDARIAEKLLGFAATEQGSALDMLRAAELTEDPKLQRLFFRHGLDEARHAQAFRDMAKHLTRGQEGSVRERRYEARHAQRQDLYERLGETRFVAFVWLSEDRARRQFQVLADRFRDRPELARLFEEIGHDEHFHTTYARHVLDTWEAEGRGEEVARALRKVKLDRVWGAWRNAGRRIGDRMIRGLLSALWLTVVPWFALVRVVADDASARWHAADADPTPAAPGLEDFRRQY